MAKNRNKKVTTEKPDLSVDQAIEKLKEEILHECRLLADNKIMTVYQLIEKTKELQILEKANGIVIKHENDTATISH